MRKNVGRGHNILTFKKDRDLTFAECFNNKPYALMNVDWIGYYNSLNEVAQELGLEDVVTIIKEYCEAS